MSPVRVAVHDLLMRIAEAEAQSRARHRADQTAEQNDEETSGRTYPEKVGNCFFVGGFRGTGKTTVLLSARKAVDKPGIFFGEPQQRQDNAQKEEEKKATAQKESTRKSGEREIAANKAESQEAAAKTYAEKLKSRIVWLDPLDLEPLQPKTNLLTFLLTRVRDALDTHTTGHTGPTSIFEESATDPRQTLTELINDATLMWEEIQEPDTRNKANRQRAAAESYATFHNRFKKSVFELSKKLGILKGTRENVSILLPIDNVDRSPDHLKSIIKLAQLVSHPCLWLVMAGDRDEVLAFLERAYWSELVHGEKGTSTWGKEGPRSEDETLGMARRQAVAAARKIWPLSHRVEIEFVGALETLEFAPLNEDTKKLRELLGHIPLSSPRANVKPKQTGPAAKDQCDAGKSTTSLLNLFDFSAKLEETKKTKEAEKTKGETPILTRAAENALCLPARSVFELWQLAWNSQENNSKDKTENNARAVKIARTMLRNVAAGSRLSSVMNEHLQKEIIRRRATADETVLYFDKFMIDFTTISADANAICVEGEPFESTDLAVKSVIRARDSADLMLAMTLKPKNMGEEAEGELLDERAAAWLSILYDILIIVPYIAVLNPQTIRGRLVRARHSVILLTGDSFTKSFEVAWPAPDFDTFVTHDIFWKRWTQLKKPYRQFFMAKSKVGQSNKYIFGLYSNVIMIYDWINCSIKTVEYPLQFEFKEKLESEAAVRIGATSDKENSYSPNNIEDWLNKLMHRLMATASDFYSKSTERDQGSSYSKVMCDWLETKLPLLFTRLYAPSFWPNCNDEQDQKRCKKNCEILKNHLRTDNALTQRWRKNKVFFYAELRRTLAEHLYAELRGTLTDKLNAYGQLPPRYRESLEEWAFGDLREALEKPLMKDSSKDPPTEPAVRTSEYST